MLHRLCLGCQVGPLVKKVLFWNLVGIASTLCIFTIVLSIPEEFRNEAAIGFPIDGLINSFVVAVMFEDSKTSKWSENFCNFH